MRQQYFNRIKMNLCVFIYIYEIIQRNSTHKIGNIIIYSYRGVTYKKVYKSIQKNISKKT